MGDFSHKLKQLLHDPVDKCLDIQTHEKRAKEYASILQVSGLKEASEADQIASSMERTLLPDPKRFGLRRSEFYQKFTEIRHPLSESYVSVEEIDKKEVLSKVKEAFFDLGKEVEEISEDKKKFFYIWRNLFYCISEKVNSGFKRYLSVLPADTRVPDHSIWEHIKITSAIDAKNNSLFLFSIGPVQGFIFQARKTRDFFMGSFLLSYLTFTGMKKIIEEYGPTSIIYPDLFGQPLMDWYLEKEVFKGNKKIRTSFSDYITQPTIPNRFVAILPESDPDKIKGLAKEIEEKIRNTWTDIAVKVLMEFPIKCERKIFENHITTFPEIYWVALPLKKKEGDIEIDDFKEFFEAKEIKSWEKLWKFAKGKSEYSPKVGLLYQLAYSFLEKEMGARKNLRDFRQTEEEGKKCHICGEREAVIKAGGKLRQGKYIDQNEGLCLLCFTKRALDVYLKDQVSEKFKDFSFPSTSEIAISKFKEKALKDAKDKFENYIKAFKKEICTERGIFEQVRIEFLPKLKKDYPGIENIDGEWFFKENLKEDSIKKNLGIERIGNLENVIKALDNLTKDKKVKLSDKDKYYAVILFDGDNMGEWLSGKNLPKFQFVYNSEIWNKLPEEFKKELTCILKHINNEKRLLSPAIHATISHALRNYSIEFVRKIVEEEHLGRLVYSGGDDVLAFVNICELFEVMRKLRAAFSGHIRFKNGKIEVDWKNNSGFVEKEGMYLLTMGKNATASCGVAIAHYKAPFRMVLLKAQQMEKKAKRDGKDAFAICLMKHSGEEREAVSKWRCGEIDVLERLDMLRRLFSKISDRFIYTLRDEFRRVKEKDGSFRLNKDGILESEIKRVIKRSVQEEELLKKIFEKIQLTSLFWKLPERNIDNFLNLLEISSFTSLEE